MQAVEDHVTEEMDPMRAARDMATDEVVLMRELRPWLEALVRMSYQGIGYRRIKNPRIWSLHELAPGQEPARPPAASPPSEGAQGTPQPSPAPVPDSEPPAAGIYVYAVVSGTFYRRASTGGEPYVREGERIRPGRVLGLIEVMKSFHEVTYRQSGPTEEAIVARVLVEDGQEVERGRPLFLVEIAGRAREQGG